MRKKKHSAKATYRDHSLQRDAECYGLTPHSVSLLNQQLKMWQGVNPSPLVVWAQKNTGTIWRYIINYHGVLVPVSYCRARGVIVSFYPPEAVERWQNSG